MRDTILAVLLVLLASAVVILVLRWVSPHSLEPATCAEQRNLSRDQASARCFDDFHPERP